jgi:integrase
MSRQGSRCAREYKGNTISPPGNVPIGDLWPMVPGFKVAFASAGFPYFNPHSFRKTLALLGGQMCKSPEEYKAWSQNLGHENVLTTFSSYGDIGRTRQAEIIRSRRQ